MPLCFAKPSPPSGWLGNFHPQAIERARHATNPRSGSRVSRRRRPHDNKCAGCHRGDWIIRRSRPIIATVCAKKLSGRSAKSEVPDTVAPTHSTASRGLFATLGESSRYFNNPKTSNTHRPKICATLALVVLISRHIAALRALSRLRCERVSPIRFIAHRRGSQLRNPCGDTCAPRR